MKDAAKKGNKEACHVLAKEIVRSRRAIQRIHTTKANMKSVQYQMNQQLCEQPDLIFFTFTNIKTDANEKVIFIDIEGRPYLNIKLLTYQICHTPARVLIHFEAVFH